MNTFEITNIFVYIKGGGLTTYNHGNMKYMKLTYGEGLRVPKM